MLQRRRILGGGGCKISIVLNEGVKYIEITIDGSNSYTYYNSSELKLSKGNYISWRAISENNYYISSSSGSLVVNGNVLISPTAIPLTYGNTNITFGVSRQSTDYTYITFEYNYQKYTITPENTSSNYGPLILTGTNWQYHSPYNSSKVILGDSWDYHQSGEAYKYLNGEIYVVYFQVPNEVTLYFTSHTTVDSSRLDFIYYPGNFWSITSTGITFSDGTYGTFYSNSGTSYRSSWGWTGDRATVIYVA